MHPILAQRTPAGPVVFGLRVQLKVRVRQKRHGKSKKVRVAHAGGRRARQKHLSLVIGELSFAI
jgi:hypothetical protein